MQLDYMQILIFGILAILLISYRVLSQKGRGRIPKVPLGLFILYVFINIAIPIFDYARLHNISASLSIAGTIVLWMALIRLVVFFVVDYFIRHRKGVVIPSITRDFALAILYVVTAMIILKHKTDVNLGSLLTTSAILTAVIGFAMQDTLGNLFSGLALQIEHPYQIGDWIGFEGMVGKVVGITWKSTKLVTWFDEMILVPNNTIAKSTLKNFSRPTSRHTAFIEIGASYDAPPHKVKQALLGIMRDNPKIVADPAPSVCITKYDNFSINYKAVFATEDFAVEGAAKAEVLNAIWYKFKREGIEIPYPVQRQIETRSEDMEKVAIGDRTAAKAEILETLGRVDMFAALPSEVKNDLAGRMSVLEFAAGEVIVRQGDPPGPMYIIKEGQCSVSVSHGGGLPAGQAGTPVEVARLGTGQFFGEMSVLTGSPRTATIKAISDLVCYEIDKGDMKAIFFRYPDTLAGVSAVLEKRQGELTEHKTKAEESGRLAEQQKGRFMFKIKAFLGL